MVELLKTYTPYIDEDKFKEILKRAQEKSFDKNGNNSSCAIVDDFAVLKTKSLDCSDSFKDLISSLKELKESGIGVVPILGYGVTELGKTYDDGFRIDKGYIIQEKALGKECLYPGDFEGKNPDECRQILMNYLNIIESIPQEHMDKYLKHYKAITDSKIAIDPSKETNFFYDKNKGFSFVDLNGFMPKEVLDNFTKEFFIIESMTPFRRLFYGQYTEYLQGAEDEEYYKKVVSACAQKYLQAAVNIGISKEELKKVFVDYGFIVNVDKLLPDEHESF